MRFAHKAEIHAAKLLMRYATVTDDPDSSHDDELDAEGAIQDLAQRVAKERAARRMSLGPASRCVLRYVAAHRACHVALQEYRHASNAEPTEREASAIYAITKAMKAELRARGRELLGKGKKATA